MAINSPAPAFPTERGHNIVSGLTRRDYFAATALQGLLAKGERVRAATEEAVAAADQLIAQLGNAEPLRT